MMARPSLVPRLAQHLLQAVGLWFLACCSGALAASAALEQLSPRVGEVRRVLRSPDGRLCGTLGTDAAGALVQTVEADGRVVVASSRVGVTLDGVDLGVGAILGAAEEGGIDETYPMLGGRSLARNRARTLRIACTHAASGTRFTLEARAYDDGFAWRLVVPGGTGSRRVSGEASSWTLPEGCRVWFAERNSAWKLKSYAGEWIACDVERLATVSKQGPVQCPPLVAELAGRAGYLLVTEAALANYSGMRLRAEPGRRLTADFTEGREGFVVEGPVVTPWRVTLFARTLDALADSDLVANLNPAPDPKLYREIGYIRPGRAVWRWWSLGTGTPEQERAFVEHAHALGFEYTVVDEGWEAWPDAWARVAALAAHARGRGVGVFLWKHYKDLADPADDRRALRTFLDAVARSGAAGVKMDFFNAESKDRVDFQIAALRLAAERRLLVNFHGIQKPTGEARTYPNEITREGVRGLELNKMAEGPLPASHNAALLFTRFAVGHGDYTPLGYSKPGPTTWAHQLATLVQVTSPLQVIGEDPSLLLESADTRPALDVLKAIPASWDETRVLAPSAIGDLALVARRSGEVWFLTALNGRAESRELAPPDLAFLGRGTYAGVLLTSPAQRTFERRELATVTAATKLPLRLGAGDGFVLWLRPRGQP